MGETRIKARRSAILFRDFLKEGVARQLRISWILDGRNKCLFDPKTPNLEINRASLANSGRVVA
jgi:hypothetical protein